MIRSYDTTGCRQSIKPAGISQLFHFHYAPYRSRVEVVTSAPLDGGQFKAWFGVGVVFGGEAVFGAIRLIE